MVQYFLILCDSQLGNRLVFHTKSISSNSVFESSFVADTAMKIIAYVLVEDLHFVVYEASMKIKVSVMKLD